MRPAKARPSSFSAFNLRENDAYNEKGNPFLVTQKPGKREDLVGRNVEREPELSLARTSSEF